MGSRDRQLAGLSKFLAFFLVLALSLVILTSVLSRTVLSSHYLEGQMTHANAYNVLSKSISAQILKDVTAAYPNIGSEDNVSITADALKPRINAAIEQLPRYYEGKAPAPVLDLRSLEAQIIAAGLPIPESSLLAQPITLGGGTDVQKVGSKFGPVKVASLIASVLLLLGLGFICWTRKKFVALPDVVIWVAIPVGLVAGALSAAPSLINHLVTFNTESTAFTAIVRTVATNITHDLAKRFMIIAIVCLVFGIVARILVGRMQPKAAKK